MNWRTLAALFVGSLTLIFVFLKISEGITGALANGDSAVGQRELAEDFCIHSFKCVFIEDYQLQSDPILFSSKRFSIFWREGVWKYVRLPNELSRDDLKTLPVITIIGRDKLTSTYAHEGAYSYIKGSAFSVVLDQIIPREVVGNDPSTVRPIFITREWCIGEVQNGALIKLKVNSGFLPCVIGEYCQEEGKNPREMRRKVFWLTERLDYEAEESIWCFFNRVPYWAMGICAALLAIVGIFIIGDGHVIGIAILIYGLLVVVLPYRFSLACPNSRPNNKIASVADAFFGLTVLSSTPISTTAISPVRDRESVRVTK